MAAPRSATRVPNSFWPRRLRINTPTVAYKADGKRIVASLSLPVSLDVNAADQWKRGGLEGMSVALFSGTNHSPRCTLSCTVMASLGSLLLYNGVESR